MTLSISNCFSDHATTATEAIIVITATGIVTEITT